MKLKIKQKVLMEHLNYVIKGISSKNLIPILTGIKFELKDEGLYLSASDSDISIRTFIPKEDITEIVSTGSVVISGKYIVEIIKKLPNTKDARNLMRFFLSGATICTFDKQGRINIPVPLTAYADLIKECIIIGVDDRLEVWSKKRWEEFVSENEPNYSEIAEKLFTPKLDV